VQTKLRVSRLGDSHEREADRTADTLMRMPSNRLPWVHEPSENSVQRASDEETEEARADDAADFVDEEFGIQKKESANGGGGAASLANVPSSGGAPLPRQVRSFFEPRFGRDLSNVRVHTGPSADQSAQSFNARAYTFRNNIVFRSGEYSPSTSQGQWLLAHELTHVAQQGYAPSLGEGAQPASSTASSALQRYGDPTLPTVEIIGKKYAEGLTDQELEMAIAQLQAEIDLHNASTPENQYLQDNMDVLTAERESRAESNTDVAFEESEFNVDEEQWSPGNPLPGLIRGDPANMRPGPSKQSEPATSLPMNTKLVIEGEQGDWYKVKTESGQSGWVTKSLVETNLPDPDAKLHIVKGGETAQKIAQHYYGPHAKEWGQDERFFVNVMYYVNEGFPAQKGSKGIYRPAPASDDWAQTQVVEGSRIWIPGVDAALALKGVVPSGSISYETWQSVKELFIGTAGFIVGLLQGALESIVDIFVGVWDLVKMVYSVIKSLVTGEIFSDIKKLVSDLGKLTIKEIVDAGLEWLKSKWFAENTWDRWHFRGWLIGYVIMEIVVTFFSGGIATALKWAGKSAKLTQLVSKFPTLVKFAEAAKKVTGPAADALRTGARIASAAHHWAASVLRIPLELIKDTAAAALERLKKLPGWIKERFRWLTPGAMKHVLGCASPCAVDVDSIEKYFKTLASATAKGAKKLSSIDDIVGALPKGINMKMIKKKLKSRPALKALIEKAELTDVDMAKMADFITAGDKANEALAYRTFVRYLTSVVPVKTQGNLTKFNEIAEAIVKANARQGAALKGSMFELFAKLNVPELGGKEFAKVTFQRSKELKLTKATRTVDNFVEDTGAVWDMKHSLSPVPVDQANDYARLIGAVTPSGKEVTSVNYLFPSEKAAKVNIALKGRPGFNVWYIDAATKRLVPL
jgi:hypothetical protein